MFDWLHKSCRERYDGYEKKLRMFYTTNQELLRQLNILKERVETAEAIVRKAYMTETEMELRKKIHRQRREIRRLSRRAK